MCLLICLQKAHFISCIQIQIGVILTTSHNIGPVVQSVVSLTSSLRVISLTVLADSIHNILIFFAEKNVSSFCNAKATHIFFSKQFQHICVSLDVNFNESLTNDTLVLNNWALVYNPF